MYGEAAHLDQALSELAAAIKRHVASFVTAKGHDVDVGITGESSIQAHLFPAEESTHLEVLKVHGVVADWLFELLGELLGHEDPRLVGFDSLHSPGTFWVYKWVAEDCKLVLQRDV